MENIKSVKKEFDQKLSALINGRMNVEEPLAAFYVLYAKLLELEKRLKALERLEVA